MIFDAIDNLPTIVLLNPIALEFASKGTLKKRVEEIIIVHQPLLLFLKETFSISYNF